MQLDVNAKVFRPVVHEIRQRGSQADFIKRRGPELPDTKSDVLVELSGEFT
jgi:hypothetical protein